MVCLRVTFDVIFLPFFFVRTLSGFLPRPLSSHLSVVRLFSSFFFVSFAWLIHGAQAPASDHPSGRCHGHGNRGLRNQSGRLSTSLYRPKKTNTKTKNKKKAKEKNTREKQPKKGQDGGAVGFFLFSFSFSSSFSFPSTSDWPSRADDSVTKARSVSNRRRRNWPTNHEGALARAAPFLCHSSLAR